MKRVRIADLKAHLSEHLRSVRAGEEVTVLDRDTPVARIVPIDSAVDGLRIRPAKLPPSARRNLPPLPPLLPGYDIVDLLMEDRSKR